MKRRPSEKKVKKAVTKDPFLKYGVGLKEYFFLQEQLIKSFCLLSLLAFVQMLIMSGFNGLNYLGSTVSFNAKVSFGNMGFAESVCSRTIIDWKSPTMQLDYHCQGTT